MPLEKAAPQNKIIKSIQELYEAKKTFIENFDLICMEIETELNKACITKNIKHLRRTIYKYVSLINNRRGLTQHFLASNIQYGIYPELQKKDPDFNLISSLFIELLPKLKECIERDLKAGINEQLNLALVPRPAYWNNEDLGTVAADQEIYIIHGGGVQHILKFLSGETLGYRLERTGLGLQVHPLLCVDDKYSYFYNRSCNDYAKLASAARLDYPAVLTGKIEAQYLDSANNPYEAGLRVEYVKFIKNIEIELMPRGTSTFTEFPDFEILKHIYQITGTFNFLKHASREYRDNFIKEIQSETPKALTFSQAINVVTFDDIKEASNQIQRISLTSI